MTPPPLVVVTGASGFVGAALCVALRRAGYRVRAVVRDAARVPPGLLSEAEITVEPQLAESGARELLRGATALVHAAGRAHVLREHAADPLAEFRRANVDGTRAVMRAAAAVGVERAVHLSSVAAFEAEPAGRVTASPYATSKLESERAVGDVVAASGLRAATLRPPMVYGPRMRGNPLRLLHAVARGVPLPLGGVRNSRSVLYVGNLAGAVVAVLRSPALPAAPVVVTDGVPVSTPDFVRAMASAIGRPARLVPVPPVLLRAAGTVADALRPVVALPLGAAAVRSLVDSLVFEDGSFAAATGFAPPFTLADGMRETAAWYHAEVRA